MSTGKEKKQVINFQDSTYHTWKIYIYTHTHTFFPLCQFLLILVRHRVDLLTSPGEERGKWENDGQ